MKKKGIKILGAGISGLTAAINLAKSGYNVIVYEKNKTFGAKFKGDLQGLENWTSKKEILQFLKDINLELNFEFEPFYNSLQFDHKLNKYSTSSSRAGFYLIKRGSFPGSLDYGLYQTALKHNVNFKFGSKQNIEDIDIVACGHKTAYLKATGYIFKTDIPKIAIAIFDDSIAPKGYTYFLSVNGYATLAVVSTIHTKQLNDYLKTAIEKFQTIQPFTMDDKRKFGGYGTIFDKYHSDKILVGEAGGFQDAMWGFGIRLALNTGYLAAESIINNTDYEKLLHKEVIPLCKSGISNRFLYNLFGTKMYKYILKGLSSSKDPIKFANRLYAYNIIKKMIYPFVKNISKDVKKIG